MWSIRNAALQHLSEREPSKLRVIELTFELFDRCIEAFENSPTNSVYARVSAVALVKAKYLAHGIYSLILDGYGQEAGALVRPMIEYAELLTYFRMHPEMAERALDNTLPKAGIRAKSIGGIYQAFREHLNKEASHSSFSEYSISHVFDLQTLQLRRSQSMVPPVLERNMRDLLVQLHLLLGQAVLSVEVIDSSKFPELAVHYERLKRRMFDVYQIDG